MHVSLGRRAARTALVAVIILAANASPCHALEPTRELQRLKVLSRYNVVTVYHDDGVTDGCWPNPAGSVAIVEKELLQAGIPLVDSETAVRRDDALDLYLNGLGYSTRYGCAVYLNLEAKVYQTRQAASLVFKDWGALLGGPKDDMGTRMNASLKEWVTEFIVLWLKSHQTKNPVVPKAPL